MQYMTSEERLIALDKMTNTRDLGGYETQEGYYTKMQRMKIQKNFMIMVYVSLLIYVLILKNRPSHHHLKIIAMQKTLKLI